MRTYQFLLVGSVVCCAALALGQTLPSALPQPLPKRYHISGRGPEVEIHFFKFDGREYRVSLPHRDIFSGPSWKPGLPLPLSFAEIEEIARHEFRKLGAEDEALQLTGFQLQRLLDTAEPRWYYAVTFRSMLDIGGDPLDRITFLVTLGGQPAQLAFVTKK